jgi:NADH/F420H2 dehydrogenase subunit C
MTDEPKDTSSEQPAGAAPAVPPKPIPPKVPPKPAAPPAPPGPPDPPPPADVAVPAYIEALQQALPGAVEKVSYWVGDWTIVVPVSRLLEVGRFLRDTPEAAFDYCSDQTAVDWPTRAQRFDLVCCLYSTPHRHRVRLKTRVADGEAAPSVTGLWSGTNWFEREIYDLFGITFTGHPDLRRMLLPEHWQGHPERKDYPLEGPGEIIPVSPADWLKLHHVEEEEPKTE